MESPGVSRIAAEEAWESEVLPASEAAPAPAESEVAPASPEGEAVPEPAEERPSMLSRLASWRAPEPEPEMEREGETEAPAPPQDEPRQLPCDHHHCRAPPGRLGLAFKDSTRVVGRVNATSALSDTVREGDELVLVNDCVVTDDDVLGILAAQDDGATARTLVFSRASARRPKDYYACYAPPGKLGIAFENDARRIVRTLVKGHDNPTGDDRYEPGFVVGRVKPTSALRGVVAVGDALVTVNEVPCCGRDVGPLLALAQPGGRRLLFARKGFRLAPTQDHDWESCGAICCLVCCCRGNKTCPCEGDGGDYSVSYCLDSTAWVPNWKRFLDLSPASVPRRRRPRIFPVHTRRAPFPFSRPMPSVLTPREQSSLDRSELLQMDLVRKVSFFSIFVNLKVKPPKKNVIF